MHVMSGPTAGLVLFVACSAAASGCGGGTQSSTSAGDRRAHELRRRAAVPARPGPLRARVQTVLSSPVQLPAAAILPGGRLLAMGGLDSTDVSASSIVEVVGSQERTIGQLPQPIHDAAAVTLGRRAYVFGGGTGESGSDSITAVDSAGGATPGGLLPVPASDVGAAVIGRTAYVVGGRSDSDTGQSSFIRAGDPRTGRVYSAGRLPQPLSDAAAVDDGFRIYVVGGRDTSGVRGEVLALEPAG